MKKLTLTAIVFLFFAMLVPYEEAFPTPTTEQRIIKSKIIELGAPTDRAHVIASAIFHSANISGLHPMLIVSLMKSESDFKEKIVSSKNYHGLMQVPYPIYDPHVNTLLGVRILQEKLRMTDGNLTKAICNYKGWKWKEKRGRVVAKRVVNMYLDLKDASLWETSSLAIESING